MLILTPKGNYEVEAESMSTLTKGMVLITVKNKVVQLSEYLTNITSLGGRRFHYCIPITPKD